MSDKYIIRNCPAYNDMPNMYNEIYGYCDNEHDIDLNKCMCENINDCVLKKIVQMCNEYSGTWEDCDYSNGLSYEILELLDIEDAEDENTQS